MSKKCGRYPENVTYPKKNTFNASILFQNWLARGIFVIRIFCSLRKEKKEFQINKELSSHPKIIVSSTYCNYLRAILFLSTIVEYFIGIFGLFPHWLSHTEE